MGDILIRNLSDATLVDLQRLADVNRTSPEEEARRRLEGVEPPFDQDAWLAQVRALRASIPPWTGPSSTEMLRADRDRDNLE